MDFHVNSAIYVYESDKYNAYRRCIHLKSLGGKHAIVALFEMYKVHLCYGQLTGIYFRLYSLLVIEIWIKFDTLTTGMFLSVGI